MANVTEQPSSNYVAINKLSTLRDIAFKQTEIEEKNFYMKLLGAFAWCAFTGTSFYLKGYNVDSFWFICSISISATIGATLPILSISAGTVGTMINLLRIYKSL